MTKYRLKKDLPRYEAGEILIKSEDGNWSDGKFNFTEEQNIMLDLALKQDWLEPIEEMTEEKAIEIITYAIRNRQKIGSMTYLAKFYDTGISGVKPYQSVFSVNADRMFNYAIGNCFKTKEEAERYAEALQFLLDNKPNND